MGLEGFVCPDEETTTLRDCLNKCRLSNRCLTLPTLKLISQEREWTGKASTTQLLNGTMMEFLKLTRSYYINPDSRAFMLQGTKHHQALSDTAKELGLPSEIPLSVDRDIFDLIEFEDGETILTDYKLWGSYRVAKVLGIEEVGKKPDPSGAVYKLSGKWGKEGTPKMIPDFRENPDKADNWEAELQLNNYRIKLEELGVKIDRLQLQVTVRDGSLFIAKDRGVYKNIYKILVRRLDDVWVRNYFSWKDEDLQTALKQGYWAEPCSSEESWDGIRCGYYCDVWDYCLLGQEVHSKGGER